MRKGSFRPSMGGHKHRPSEKPMMRFGRPVRSKASIRNTNEESSYRSDDSYTRRDDDGPGIGTAIIAGFLFGGLLS